MRKTAINLISVLGGEVLLRAANFVAVVVIARLYGATTLGLYATVLAFATVAVMVAENGLQISSITEIGRRPEDIDATVSRLCALRVVLSFAMGVVLIAIGWWSRWTAQVWMVGALVTGRVLLYSYSQLQFSVLKSIDRMSLIGPTQLCTFLLLVLGIAATYLRTWSLEALLWCFIVAQVVEITLSLRVLWNAGIRPAKFLPSDWWHLLKRSTPVGLTCLLAGVTMRTDIIVLSAFGTRLDVGLFSAAHIGVVLFYSLSWLFASVILPDFTRRVSDSREFERYAKRWTRLLLFVALPGAFVASCLARPVVLFLYGRDFALTGELASVMVLAIPFILLNAVYLSRAIVLGATRIYLGTYTVTAIVAVLLDVLLVKSYAAKGIAVAIVVREVAIFLAFLFQARSVRTVPFVSASIPACAKIEIIDA